MTGWPWWVGLVGEPASWPSICVSVSLAALYEQREILCLSRSQQGCIMSEDILFYFLVPSCCLWRSYRQSASYLQRTEACKEAEIKSSIITSETSTTIHILLYFLLTILPFIFLYSAEIIEYMQFGVLLLSLTSAYYQHFHVLLKLYKHILK